MRVAILTLSHYQKPWTHTNLMSWNCSLQGRLRSRCLTGPTSTPRPATRQRSISGTQCVQYKCASYTAPSGLRLLDTFGTLPLTSAVNLHKQVILVYCSVVKLDRCLRLRGEKWPLSTAKCLFADQSWRRVPRTWYQCLLPPPLSPSLKTETTSLARQGDMFKENWFF